jgi:hypothetical protein
MNSRRLQSIIRLPQAVANRLPHDSTSGHDRRLLHCGIWTRPMTVVGHDRSFGDVSSMSGLRESGHGWVIYEYTS